MYISSKLKHILFILLLFSIVKYSNAQIVIKGTVIDSISLKPVSYASIGIYKTTKGTVTNEAGSFVFTIDSFPLRIIINAVGYYSKEFVISKHSSAINLKLKPAVYNVGEVEIKANEADKIFEKAFLRLNQQAPFTFKSKSFFRLLTQNDSSYSEMIEAFYDTWVGNTGIGNWEMTNGRYALASNAKQQQYVTSLDFSLITRYANILNKTQTDLVKFRPFVFDKRYSGKLLFSIGERFSTDSQEIVRIDFRPKAKHKKMLPTEGSIYIDAQTFEVYRLVQTFTKWETPLINLTNQKFYIQDLKALFEFNFQKTNTEKMVINAINVDVQYDIFNSTADTLFHRVNTKSNLVFYEYETASASNVDLSNVGLYKSDYQGIKEKLYMPKFWEKNQVLAELPIQEKVRMSFEKDSLFLKTFRNGADTTIIVGTEYSLWRKNLTINQSKLSTSSSGNHPQNELRLLYRGEPFAELNGELYFSWNCMNDTFYHISLAMINNDETWFIESEAGVGLTEFIYSSYFNLIEIYRRKLEQQLKQIDNPCSHNAEISKLYDRIKAELYEQSRLMLNECWGAPTASERMRGCYKWSKIIDPSLDSEK